MNYGTVRRATPDGQVREHPLDTPNVTLGRSGENRIVIDHLSVSRRHARITIDSGMPFIEDLGSDGGTFVAGQRMPPGDRHLFGSQPVRLGEVEVHFIAPQATFTSGPTAAAAAAAPPPSQALAVMLTGPNAPAAPGSTVTATVEIHNRGSTVDEVRISVLDLPPGWGQVNRPIVSLLPGARDEVTVTLTPPRSNEAVAGDYPFGVAAVSTVRGTEVRVLGVLSVESFAGFTLAIHPVRSDRNFKVNLSNTGNAPAALALSAQDDEGKLRFDFESMNVDLHPGEQRTVSLKAKMPGAPKLGREVITPFRVEAAAQRDGTKSTASGQLRIKPKFEAWRVPAIALVVLAGLAGGGVAYASRCEDWSLPGCGEDAGTADDDDQAQGGATASATVAGGGGGTPTAATTQTTPTGPTASPTTPAPSPTKHVPGTLKFPKAEIVLDPDKDYLAIVTTTAGEFVIDLDVEGAYETSNSFAFLGLKGFYDGMPFEPRDSSVEHGDPEGDGTGTPGYVQKVELTNVANTEGTVGMIRLLADLGTVGSQWYVNLEDNTDPFNRARIRGNPRPVFGTIIKGLEVAAKLTDKDTVEGITIEEK